jgi:hypothetical protein
MKRNVPVCAGVVAVLVGLSAGAEDTRAEAPAAGVTAASSERAPAVASLSAAPLVEATAAGGTAAAPQATPALAADATVRKPAEADEVHVPVSLTLLPNISTSGLHTGNVVNNFTVGLLATHAKRVEGLAMSLGANWVEAGLSGLQLAVGANVSRGPVTGGQFSVGGNVATGDFSGTQQAVGLNVVRGAVTGAQLAVGGNVAAGELKGAQFGVGANVAAGSLVGAQFAVGANIASGKVHGLQAAVGANVANELTGLQTSSGISYARHLDGAQLSLINVGGDVSGAQVGLLNVAGKVDGLQLGLVNVARESEGEAVGLLSFIGNGQANVQAWASDVAYTNVAVKFGGRHLHTLLTAGFNPGTTTHRRRYVLGAGFGLHLPAADRLFFDVDVLGSSVHTDHLFRDGDGKNVLGQLRLVAGYQVARRFALIGGVTGNTLVTWENGDTWKELGIGPEWQDVSDNGRTTVRVWPGVLLGVQL